MAFVRYPGYVGWTYNILSILGRFFTTAGVIVFLFVGYQLWGTNFAEARGQDELQAQAEKLFDSAPANAGGETPATTAAPAAPGSPTTKPSKTAPAPPTNTGPPPPPRGSAVAMMKIPRINLEKAIIEGTSVEALKKAPGHYTGTPLPGQPGNAAIAGHRTTYGAPFSRIGELKKGDEIDVTTRQGQFVYRVTGIKIVSPSDVSVIKPTSDNRLTLTTCHPKFSAAQRLIVSAALDPGAKPAPGSAPPSNPPADAPAGEDNGATGTTVVAGQEQAAPSTVPANSVADITEDSVNGANLSGAESPKGPAILWGAISALVLLCVWGAGRLIKFWPSWIIGTPILLIVLFVFFENFALLLPANA